MKMVDNGAPTPVQPSYEVPPQGTQPPPYDPNQATYYAQPVAAPKSPGLGSAYKGKWEAVVLAFTLGWLGMHKFYLGYKTEGLIMLLVGVIGLLCTAGLGLLVMEVIAIIEAVRYLTLTQEDFERIYVQGRKGWF